MQTLRPESPSRPSPIRRIRLLHNAIRQIASDIVTDVRQLQPLASDDCLVGIERRFELLQDIVLSHCRAEDDTLIPALTKKASQASSKANTETANSLEVHSHLAETMSGDIRSPQSSSSNDENPPKRRRLSPVSVNLEICLNDHVALTESFNSVRSKIARARQAPCSSLVSGPSESHGATDPRQLSSGHAQKSSSDLIVQKQRDTVWDHVLDQIREDSNRLEKSISAHLDNEERDMLPMCENLLNASEQGELLVRTLLLSGGTTHWPKAFRHMGFNDLVSLFEEVDRYASDNDLTLILKSAAPFIPSAAWEDLCQRIPRLARCVVPERYAFAEIEHLHTAIEKELEALISFSSSMNPTSTIQVQSLMSRFEFVCELNRALDDAKSGVILPLLEVYVKTLKLNQLFFAEIQPRHVSTVQLANGLQLKLKSMLNASTQRFLNPVFKEGLLRDFRSVAEKIIAKLHGEKLYLYPFVRQHVTAEDQGGIADSIMNSFSAPIFEKLLPWLSNLLTVDELESTILCMFRRSSSSQVRSIVRSLVCSVQKEMTDRDVWKELRGRVPLLVAEEKIILSEQAKDREGPVSEILRVHKAIRVDLNELLRRIRALPVDGSFPNPRTLSAIAASVAFLRRMVDDHSKSEDEILLPRLEARVPGCSDTYKGEHCDERTLFAALAKCLEELQCVADESCSANLVRQLQVAARTLRDDLFAHLVKEEEQMWPLVKQHFNKEEQSQIVALIFGHMSADRLRELLPWMIRVLSVTERNEMMEHILQVTRSTMFEKWLRTWLPLDKIRSSGTSERSHSNPSVQTTGTSDLHTAGVSAPDTSTSSEDKTIENILRTGRENLEERIKEIARDESIDMEKRARLMQRVMLAQFTQRQEDRGEGSREQREVHKDDKNPTFRLDASGTKRFGCPHYLRAVKLRGACCNRLYTCRLCHDDAEQTHVLDRYATTEVLCMRCGTLQPASERCINSRCGKKFARYFCSVCKIYDDDESRQLYHCPGCNVCRVGKGLGIDFFHCMKCNQCMSIRYQKGHKCVENAMESDCPVCFEYLFTSTSPVKYLPCGHLMHTSCFEKYRLQRISCPVCSKSLPEMARVYKNIDRLMSEERNEVTLGDESARCEVFCNDCNQKSEGSFQFVLQRCPHCSSYNTRVSRVIDVHSL